MRYFVKVFFFVLLFLSKTILSDAAYSISPIHLAFSKEEHNTSLDFLYIKKFSSDNSKKYFQVVLENLQGSEKLEPSGKNIMVSPYIFSLNPGQTQKIRFALKKHLRNNRPNEEKVYKVIIKELPNKKLLPSQKGVQFRYNVAVLMRIEPKEIKILEPLCSYRDTSSGVSVSVQNSSNIMHKISGLKISPKKGKEKIETIVKYAFPNSKIKFEYKSKKTKALSIRVKKDPSSKTGTFISCKKTI